MLERGGEGRVREGKEGVRGRERGRERGEREEGEGERKVKIDNFIFLSYFSTHCCDPI